MIDKPTVAETLQALAHEARLDVFLILMAAGPEGLAAGTLGERLDMGSSALSFHLTRLRHAGLVRAQRDGQHIIYSACYERMEDLVAYLTEHCCRDSVESCGPDCGGRNETGPGPVRREQSRSSAGPDEPVPAPTKRAD